ncbi:MAG: phage late control D family protein [Hyphomicrobiales bacterium]|nr:phage late control D family protein [Hyphomicrobiales bacterium]
MTEEAVLSTGPIYTPRPVLEVDGQTDDMIQTLLLSMDITESDHGLSAVELKFNNTATVNSQGNDYAFEYSDNDLLSLGKSMIIRAGDQNDPQELFRGVISGIEMLVHGGQQPRLIVLAEDALQRARLARRTRLHPAGTVSSIVRSVAAELGLNASVTGLDQNVDDQMQLNQSDLAFLRYMVKRFDGELQIVGDQLQVCPRADIRRNEITLELGSQLLSIRALADLSHQVSRVTYAGWDVAAGTEVESESNAGADLGPGRGRTGACFIENVFGERSEHLSHAGAENQAESQALVNAAYSERARKFVCAEGLSVGNPNIRVGTHVTLTGLGPRFNNTYYVTKTHHSFDTSRGYLTRFQAECAYLGG